MMIIYPNSLFLFGMIIPPHLREGDRVAIVSTARKITTDELKPAFDLLKEWGFIAVPGRTIGVEDNQFAGDDSLRAADLQQMLDDPEIKAIWCARGGYGTVRIIDQLDFTEFLRHPKWIVGYSDITVLHAHLNQRSVASLHAQMPLEIEKRSPETALSIRKALLGQLPAVNFQPNSPYGRKGTTNGILLGGNLSVLYSLQGSQSAITTRGRILFLEDLDEYLYHIDRMMQNLKRNGMLHDLAGLVVGGMSDMNDNSIPFGKTAEAIIWDYVKEFDYPVCFGFPAGHTYENRAMRFGAPATLEVGDEQASLLFSL